MSNLDLIRGRKTVVPLTNKSGGQVIAGDVVIVNSANDESFTTTTTGGFVAGLIGVATETIANDAVGRVAFGGYVPLVNVDASVTRGQFGKTHTVAKQATNASARAAGTFCVWLKSTSTPSAILFGAPDEGGGSGATFAGVWATKTASFPSLTDGADVTLAFDAADIYDTDAFHDTVTNNSRLTVPAGKAGKYVPWGKVEYASNATGRRIVDIAKNGSIVLRDARQAVNGQATTMTVTFQPLALLATDYLELHARQDSGGALSTTAQDFGMYLLPGS